MEWIFTGNIARIGKKYEILDSLGERARVLTYLREALSSTDYERIIYLTNPHGALVASF
jgi:hypothetical protein